MVRVFISSVQKELEVERVSIAGAVTGDPVLRSECEIVLYENEPLSGRRISKPYLECLGSCDVYLLMVDREYGRVVGEVSATHEEYRHAMKRGMHILVLARGNHDAKREEGTKSFFEEIKADGHTYKRFHDRVDLLPEVRRSLVRILRESFGRVISPDAMARAESAAEKASPFEQQVLEIRDSSLALDVARKWLRAIRQISEHEQPGKPALLNRLREKGLVRKGETGTYKAMASGLLFLGKDPSAEFPQCRILVDAYAGTEPDPRPRDQETLSVPAPVLVERVVEFVMRNTRHPIRVKGIQRISLDEYPSEVVREAVVNAIAHRDYEDTARPIYVKLFYDRLEILSPGDLLRPLTISKLTKGNYEPCSRNPTLAQYLGHLQLMEQRGSGIRRMHDAMAIHGLEPPEYVFRDGYFVVRLKGPGDDLDRIQLPEQISTVVPANVEDRLTKRQKEIAEWLAAGDAVTNRECQDRFGISKVTATKDLTSLVEMGVAERTGQGRSVRYVYRGGNR
jgi:predicted HTH transcriptional regulator